MRLTSFYARLAPSVLGAALCVPSSQAQVSVTPAAGGAQLVTFYNGGIPQVAVLEDGSPGGSGAQSPHFRQVWLLTEARPSWKQRMASGIPFFYHRAGINEGSAKSPLPLLDLANPTKGTTSRIGETVAQDTLLNSYGILLRAPTRAYIGNSLDARNMDLVRALDIVEAADYSGSGLDKDDFDELRGRLLLGQRLLGGFVDGERVAQAASHDRTRDLEDRAANWDLLRQAAEANGLYVQPLEASEAAPQQAPQHAVLWIADREPAPTAHFTPGFLAIADPFALSFYDTHIKPWTGYTAAWSLDSDGAVVSTQAGDPASATRMIPLAVYALDYPRVPLLLIDFHSERARRREVFRRTAGDVTTSIFGITPYSSLSWFAARNSYLWVRDRHGAAFNRSQRLASYARLRQTLLDDRGQIDPRFHQLLETKLDAIALNPFEQGSSFEANLADRQYTALRNWIDDPNGLARTLERQRAAENYRQHHTPTERALASTLHIATFGAWKPYHAGAPETVAKSAVHQRQTINARVPPGSDGLVDGQ